MSVYDQIKQALQDIVTPQLAELRGEIKAEIGELRGELRTGLAVRPRSWAG